ncbi:MAG: hypothetical protein NC823_02485, partial [Candidatus Omnitrophica bacterium]|nr:hypothetical protein [Candidatus Omnitrophota bacterium]
MKSRFLLAGSLVVLLSFVCTSLCLSQPARKKPTTPKTVPKTAPRARFGVNMQPDGAILYTDGIFYMVQAESINSGGNILYFGAKDFANGKDLIVKKVAKSELKVDEPNRNMVKTTMLLGSGQNDDPVYRL